MLTKDARENGFWRRAARESWRPATEWLVLLGVLAYFITLLKGAWLSDDYFITLRQVEQLFAGHGIRFNLYERAFLSTSVAYFFILLPLRLITSDPFVIHGIFALTCNAALLWLLWKLARGNVWVWLLGLGLLFASKAHFDYSWFGQENPLGHVLVAALVLVWLRIYPGLNAGRPPSQSYWRCFVALIAIAPLYRHDFILLAWPLAAWALWDNRTSLGWSGVVRAVGWMLAPLLAWTLFSLVYFGFPLPQSAYSKLPDSYGMDHRLYAAWDYYRFSLHKDSLMVAALLGSQLLWLGRAPARVLAGAVALAMLYIVLVGADYMGGRFFTVPYVCLVALATGTSCHWRRDVRAGVLRSLGVGLAIWVVLWPHSPLTGALVYKETVVDRETYPSMVANERASWQPETGIIVWLMALRDGTTYPNDITPRLGVVLGDQAAPGATFHVCNLGMTPYRARLDQNFIDVWGLADSFMARLPATNLRPGHLVRVRPIGLAESLVSGRPAFADPGLNRYFETLRGVTGGERLLSPSRIRDLIKLNLGLHAKLLPGTIEPGGFEDIVPAAKYDLLPPRLAGLLGSDTEIPLCNLIVDPRADALLRELVP